MHFRVGRANGGLRRGSGRNSSSSTSIRPWRLPSVWLRAASMSWRCRPIRFSMAACPNAGVDTPLNPASEYGRQKADLERRLRARIAEGAPLANIAACQGGGTQHAPSARMVVQVGGGRADTGVFGHEDGADADCGGDGRDRGLLTDRAQGIFQLSGPRDVDLRWISPNGWRTGSVPMRALLSRSSHRQADFQGTRPRPIRRSIHEPSSSATALRYRMPGRSWRRWSSLPAKGSTPTVETPGVSSDAE